MATVKHKIVRMAERVEAFNASPPGLATIWRRRSWDEGRWIGRTRVPGRVLRKHLARLGFRLGPAGLTHAPCAGCGEPHAVAELSSIRLCDECGAGTPETLCRREREGKTPRRDLQRVYTPGVRRRPVSFIQR